MLTLKKLVEPAAGGSSWDISVEISLSALANPAIPCARLRRIDCHAARLLRMYLCRARLITSAKCRFRRQSQPAAADHCRNWRPPAPQPCSFSRRSVNMALSGISDCAEVRRIE